MVMSANKLGRKANESGMKGVDDILKSVKAPDMKGGDTELKAAAAPQKAQSFGEAFKAARAKALDGGPKTFTWGGKSFTTQVKGEGGSKPAAKLATNKSSTSSSPVGDFYLNKYPKIKGNAANIKGAGPMSTGKADTSAPAANRTSPPAAQRSKDSTVTGRQMLANLFSAGREKEKEISRRAGKGTNSAGRSGLQMLADRQSRFDAANKAETERRRAMKKGGKVAPKKMAKGGSIDGCAIRGKTRAPMKKGK